MKANEAAFIPLVDKREFQELLAKKRELNDEQIAAMLQRIQPLVRYEGELYYIKPVHPREVSFMWAPERTGPAMGLKLLTTIPTLHAWGYYGFFKPSIEEVLSMIPEDLLPKVSAFETLGPVDANDLSWQPYAFDAGYHLAVTTLYTANSG